MTQSPHSVGCGQHRRFQKGQSGSRGGKPGPGEGLKHVFCAALSGALKGNRQTLRDTRPTTMIEALARKVALDALDGRPPAQKFVAEILEGADCGGAARTRIWARPKRGGRRPSKRPGDRGGESNGEDEEEIGRSDSTIFPGAGKKAGKI